MSARDLLREADRLRHVAERATKIANGMDMKYNRAHDIGGVTLYSHAGFAEDLVLIRALQAALEQVAAEHVARADETEARVAVSDER